MESRKPSVAFLGPKASYTHQATLNAFDETKYNLLPQITIEDVFSAVQGGAAFRGVIPFENSSNGSVVFTLDLFADIAHRYPDILVTGEVYVDVHHCLVGYASPSMAFLPQNSSGSAFNSGASPISSGKVTPTANHPYPSIPRTAPLTGIGHIKKLYSHPQAWGQCKTFLTAYFKGVERQDISSTSKAAEIVSQDPSGETAAISSEIAAKVYGLDLLAQGIEDLPDNTTRFLIIYKKDQIPDCNAPVISTDSVDVDANMARYKTLVSFTIDHTNPGALADSLAVFKPYKLNLTSINSRPSGIAPWNYIFLIELQGKRLDGDIGAVNAALRDLGQVARAWRWLGSWESKQVNPTMKPILEDP